MYRQLVGEVASLSHFDWINIPYQVGHRDVGCRELLPIARIAGYPLDLHEVIVLLEQAAALGADWRVGVVVDFATLDDRDFLVKQMYEQAGHACLALTALTQEDDVLA